MALVTLPNVYCTAQDVYEYIGTEAAQLRLDDRHQGSGQEIVLNAAASSGATSLTVAALEYPLLKGTVLVFDQAGMSSPVEVTLSAAAAANATTLAVSAIGSAIAAGAIAIDNGVNVWLGSLLAKGCKYATAQIKRYCCNRYNDSDLAQSWSVNFWATVIAARWVSKRRYQSAPQGVEDDYKEVLAELKAVQIGQLHIEDIGTRTSGWPFMVNSTMDDRYTYRKLRTESPLSEGTPTQFAQSVDWNSIWMVEY